MLHIHPSSLFYSSSTYTSCPTPPPAHFPLPSFSFLSSISLHIAPSPIHLINRLLHLLLPPILLHHLLLLTSSSSYSTSSSSTPPPPTPPPHPFHQHHNYLHQNHHLHNNLHNFLLLNLHHCTTTVP